MPNINEVINDSDFLSLPKEEQRKVLRSIDNNFQGLGRVEQDKVLNTFRPISAITGKPVPTKTEEAIKIESARKGIIRQGLPIAGDIAVTSLVPQLGIPAKLPGLAKLPLLAKLPGVERFGSMGAKLVSRMLASALGSAGGEAAGQALTQEGIQPGDIKQEAIMGAGGELGTSALAAPFSLLRAKPKPDIAGFAAREKIPVPLTATEPGPVSKALDVATDLSIAGRQIKEKARGKLIRKTTEKAKDFVGEFGLPVIDKQTLGQNIGTILNKKGNFTDTYAPYKELLQRSADEGGGKIFLDDTIQELNNLRELAAQKITQAGGGKLTPFQVNKKATDEVVRDFGFAPDSQEGRAIKTFMEIDTLNPKTVEYFLTKVFNKWGDSNPFTRASKEKLKETMLNDIGRITSGMADKTAQQFKQEADEIFKQAQQFLTDNPTAKRIISKARVVPGKQFFEAFPERVIDDLFVKASPDELSRIITEIGKTKGGNKAVAGLEYQFIQRMFDPGVSGSAMRIDDITGELTFMPARFSELVEQNKEVFFKAFPGSLEKVREFANFSKSIAPEFKKAAQSGEALQVAKRAVGGSIGAATLGPVAGVIVPETFGAATALGLVSPVGQKLLKGLIKVGKRAAGVGTKTGLRIGLREVFESEELKKEKPAQIFKTLL